MGEFKASQYQKAIFDEIENGNSNIVIEAAAGSGKTTTIVHAIGLIPSDKKVLVIAFNRDIVAELTKKLEGRKNTTVKTLHGLGLAMLYGYMRGLKPNINDYKYRTYLHDNMLSLTRYNLYGGKKSDYTRFLNCTMKVINIGRCCLCDSKENLIEVCKRYGINTIKDEIDVAMSALEWGRSNIGDIDYTDMIWLPHSLGMRNNRLKYDYVFIDECQDLNMAQMELFKSCLKTDGRFVAVGDKNQGIYAFAGADALSFDKIKSIENTKSLPLSITYRCAKEIVKIAQKYVPSIEANPENDTVGVVENNVSVASITDDSMVLCRNNAPLIELYSSLLENGRKCYVRGKDIGANLISLLNTTDEDILNVGLNKKGVFSELYLDMFTERNHVAKSNRISKDEASLDPGVQNKYDMICSLKTLAKGCRTKSQLADKVKTVFADNDGEGIALSTVHKAKGLEADEVFILEKSLMPSGNATKEWEIEQEDHLIYVAYTRAKRRLAFLEESKKDGLTSTQKTINDMTIAEVVVNRLYGISNDDIMTDTGYSKVVVTAAEVLEDKRIGGNNVKIGEKNAAKKTMGRFCVKSNRVRRR